MELETLYRSQETTRNWVYQNQDQLNSELKTPRNIEINRIIASTPAKIDFFTSTLFPILNDIKPALRFCSDETMLEPIFSERF